MPIKKLRAITMSLVMLAFLGLTSSGVYEVSLDEVNFDSSYIKWSNPSVPHIEPPEMPYTRDVSHSEWNKIFADWKSGDVSKEETIKILKEVKRV